MTTHQPARYRGEVGGRPAYLWIVKVEDPDNDLDGWTVGVKSHTPDSAIRWALEQAEDDRGTLPREVYLYTYGSYSEFYRAVWSLDDQCLTYTDHPPGWVPGAEYRPEGKG